MTPAEFCRERAKMWRERFDSAANEEDVGEAIRCGAKASECALIAAQLEEWERTRA
jgi:hypothetical protein